MLLLKLKMTFIWNKLIHASGSDVLLNFFSLSAGVVFTGSCTTSPLNPKHYRFSKHIILLVKYADVLTQVCNVLVWVCFSPGEPIPGSPACPRQQAGEAVQVRAGQGRGSAARRDPAWLFDGTNQEQYFLWWAKLFTCQDFILGCVCKI